MLTAEGVNVRFRGREILSSVSLDLAPGRLTGVVGPNGAGKTTLVRALAGLVPFEGKVQIGGRPLVEFRRRELARHVAVMFQEAPPAFGYLVRDVVAAGRYPHLHPWRGPGPQDERAISAAMERAGVAGLAERPLQELSGGERQLVQLARVLAQEAHVLLLDEPAANLDVRHRAALEQRLRELRREKAILYCGHDLNAVAGIADELLLLHAGRVAARGAPADVLTPERIGRVFGVRAVRREQLSFQAWEQDPRGTDRGG